MTQTISTMLKQVIRAIYDNHLKRNVIFSSPGSRVIKYLFALILLSTLPVWSKAEGTRELQPQSSYGIQLRPNYDPNPTSTEGGPFATPAASHDYKLWVTISSSTEKMLFGFQKANTQEINLTIFNSSGVKVYPTSSASIALPTSGAGYIASWDQAFAGPSTLNASGYTALEFIPGTAGDYYFEFSWSSASGSRLIKFFDITVVNASNVEKRGRLWSKNWQMETVGTYTPFYGKMYPYTDDLITTEINFNGMAPARFTVACNSTGCDNTGNFANDRKSRDGNHTYPAYKIFVNNPDETLYPTGIVGGVDSVHLENPCDGNVDISIYVTKPGMADLILDINPEPGVQDEDVTLTDSVFDGNATTIHWDGLNGLGEPVPNGTTFNIELTYVNGLTHLPLYDVEYSMANGNKWSGFIVNLIRPAGSKPPVFWDDRDLGGGADLSGCTDITGCHSWGSPSNPYSIGNEDTYNTWWFAVSTTLVPITIQYRRSETIPVSYILCEGDSVNVFGNWVSAPGVFRDTATNFMGCDSITEVTVTVKPGPVIDLGPDQLLCQGESTTLGMVVPDVASYEWNTIPPLATPLGTDPTLTVSTTGIYQVQITANNGCIRTDQVHVTAASMINQNLIKHN